MVTLRHLAIDQEPQALLEAQIGDSGHLHLVGEGLYPAGELQLVEFVESRMASHEGSPWVWGSSCGPRMWSCRGGESGGAAGARGV